MDNNISRHLTNAVSILNHSKHLVRHITEDPRFTERTEDLVWMPNLAEDNISWIVMSGDANIIDTAQERAMLLKCRLMFFCMDKYWMKTRIEDQTWKFFKVWSEIERHSRNPEPSLHLVRTGPGSRLEVEMISQGYRSRGGKMRD